MKKMNNKGFLLVESLVVTTFVLTVLVFLFVQFKNLFDSYENSYDYNTVEGIYNLNTMKEFIQANESTPLSGNTVLVRGGNCTTEFIGSLALADSASCDSLVDAMSLQTLIYTPDSASGLDAAKSFSEVNSFDDFIDRLSPQENNNRLLGQFIDNIDPDNVTYTYASVTYNNIVELRVGGMMKSWGTNSIDDFHDYKKNITSVSFVNSATVPGDAVDSWNVSEAVSESGDETVMAWITGNETDGYALSIGANGTVYANYNSSYLFAGFTRLTTIDFNNFNTSMVINAEAMFQECGALTSVSGLTLNSVTNTSKMFAGSGITSLDGFTLNTDNITDMSSMFASCTGLESLDLSDWNTENVTNMSSMFVSCTNLTDLDLSGWNTSKVINMQRMFNGIGATDLNLCSFDTNKINKINGIFDGGALTTIHVGASWTFNAEDLGMNDASKELVSDCSGGED